MARPQEHDKRRQLARRAVEVLQREGLGISMAQLARALDVKRPTLLYHFPQLSHIVELALEELLTDQMMYVIGEVAKHDHPIDKLYAQLRAVHAYHQGKEATVLFLTQAIATSAGQRMPSIIDVGNRVFAAHREQATARIRAGIEDGTVAPCDPDALIALVRALTDGLLVQRVMTDVDLAPAHELLWKQLLEPLRLQPDDHARPAPRAAQPHSTEASP